MKYCEYGPTFIYHGQLTNLQNCKNSYTSNEFNSVVTQTWKRVATVLYKLTYQGKARNPTWALLLRATD